MTIHFASTSLADWVMTGDATAADVVAAGSAVDPYCLEGFTVNDNRIYTADVIDPFEDFWCRLYTVGSGDNLNVFDFYDVAFSTTQAVLRIRGNTGNGSWAGNILVQAWNGSSWTTLATSVSALSTVRAKIDIQYVRDNSAGIVRIYVNNTLDIEVTGIDTDLAAWTEINRVQLAAGTSAGGDAWIVSGIIIASVDTRNYVFVQEAMTGDGATTDFTGSYTDVDETGLDEANGITSNVTDDVSTFVGGLNAIIDSGYNIVASIISMNINAVGGAVDVAGVRRISGTDYEDTPIALGPGTHPGVQFISELSPATAAAYTAAEVEGMEYGVANKTA